MISPTPVSIRACVSISFSNCAAVSRLRASGEVTAHFAPALARVFCRRESLPGPEFRQPGIRMRAPAAPPVRHVG